MKAAVLCMYVCVCALCRLVRVSVCLKVSFFSGSFSHRQGQGPLQLPPQHDPVLVTQPLFQETQRTPLVSISVSWPDTSTAQWV